MGVILDVNNARVVHAIVKAESGDLKRRTISNDEGGFEIPLPPGNYQITVEANGFRRFTSPLLTVQPRKSEVINIHLVVETPRGLVPASSSVVSRQRGS